ncbi:cold-shock protein [Pseudomonas synxantha]|uniref:Cold shock domain-containing protein n=1 Tax=Pseudomonas synxantha TaxID=47883 RepID=A0ABS0URN6_9PSED|nr:cold shock domain-containing protein [Pseudomonas synxantha]MBI6566957.1 cold shock domain-containing protein [Pseudomonas synxantha]MBI6582592.1 cold shock domain-containing protein [Pseudomonas synxantha]MBI6643176.1 cold shock domain-containing protein [Pseudomonas synxantha]MDQ0982302.1 CspA family cold shock protein [Pseudomonas synxantha]
MDKGTVRWFDAVKGIGFIARDRDGNEVAVESKGAKNAEAPPAAPKRRKPRKRKKPLDT